MSRDILLSRIDPDPDQPRDYFDPVKIDELAESMKQNGLAVPILLRPVGNRYVIVHGERRYRAAQQLGWAKIPADVREMDTDTAHWLAFAENLMRADLSPIEEARFYQARLTEGLTQAELGARIGKSQQYVASRLALLKLAAPVQEMITTRVVTPSAGEMLAAIDDPELQISIAQTVTDERLSVRQCRELIASHKERQALVMSIPQCAAYFQAGDLLADVVSDLQTDWQKLDNSPDVRYEDLAAFIHRADDVQRLAAELTLRWQYLGGKLLTLRPKT